MSSSPSSSSSPSCSSSSSMSSSAAAAAAAATAAASAAAATCASASLTASVNQGAAPRSPTVVRGERGGGGGEGERPSSLSTTKEAHSPQRGVGKRNTIQLSDFDTGRRCTQCEDCPGFISHEWRKLCIACRCSRDSHSPIATLDNGRRVKTTTTTTSHSGQARLEEGYGGGIRASNCEHFAGVEGEPMVLEGFAWSPPGLSADRAQDWMRQLPAEKVPKLDTDGEKYRELQLIYQLPKQDLSLKYCHHVDSAQQPVFQEFVSARNDLALDVGVPVDSVKERASCFKCGKTIVAGGLAVAAPRFGPATFWHPACFTCATCDELLVDLTYCLFDEKIFCERHYAENLKPRCGACDELLFCGQYTKALNKDWHCDHFCCWNCDTVLTGQRYVLTDEHPCCIPCYEQNFTHCCAHCTKKIGLDAKDMSYKELHWHEDCFSCQKCRTSLVDKPFAAKNTFIFCGGCYDSEFASRCDACGDTFRPGMKKMEYKTRKWHDTCFQCAMCKVAVGSKPFIIPNDTDVYCVTCFEEKFATKCSHCKKIMTTGGVTFKNEAWHRECFVCANCGAMLAGQKFASRNDKPYCANCFGDLFAKRCTACTKPITGAGGTRFISFEGRHWHSQCFMCALCKVSMAGKGFITDGEDIICPDCAKEKLMGPGTNGGGVQQQQQQQQQQA